MKKPKEPNKPLAINRPIPGDYLCLMIESACQGLYHEAPTFTDKQIIAEMAQDIRDSINFTHLTGFAQEEFPEFSIDDLYEGLWDLVSDADAEEVNYEETFFSDPPLSITPEKLTLICDIINSYRQALSVTVKPVVAKADRYIAHARHLLQDISSSPNSLSIISKSYQKAADSLDLSELPVLHQQIEKAELFVVKAFEKVNNILVKRSTSPEVSQHITAELIAEGGQDIDSIDDQLIDLRRSADRIQLAEKRLSELADSTDSLIANMNAKVNIICSPFQRVRNYIEDHPTIELEVNSTASDQLDDLYEELSKLNQNHHNFSEYLYPIRQKNAAQLQETHRMIIDLLSLKTVLSHGIKPVSTVEQSQAQTEASVQEPIKVPIIHLPHLWGLLQSVEKQELIHQYVIFSTYHDLMIFPDKESIARDIQSLYGEAITFEEVSQLIDSSALNIDDESILAPPTKEDIAPYIPTTKTQPRLIIWRLDTSSSGYPGNSTAIEKLIPNPYHDNQFTKGYFTPAQLEQICDKNKNTTKPIRTELKA